MNQHIKMRAVFAQEVYKHMKKNKSIWVITGDLGYKMWDTIREDFPERFLNVGAAEQAATGLAIGLALSGKIPILYNITPFLLYRPFETIRNYIEYERIPVKLVGAGRDKDYVHDGISHWALEDKRLMKLLPHIKSNWPKSNKDIPQLVTRMIKSKNPWYINLRK